MTRLARITVNLKPCETAARVTYWTGIIVRAWFLKQTAIVSPELATSSATNNQIPRYTASVLHKMVISDTTGSEANLVSFTITTLDDSLTDLWQSHILPALQGTTIYLDEQPYQVVSIQDETTTDSHLVKQRTLSAELPPRAFTLRFRTPVTFHSFGAPFPFPTPDLVFGNLLERWNALCAIHLHPDVRTFARECIRITRYRMESKRIDTGDSPYGTVIGGVGETRYVIWRGDEYWKRVVHTLVDFSHFSGVGARTTIGMGQVEVLSQGI